MKELDKNLLIERIGKDGYTNLLKKYNLCTKKWTWGRTKPFYKEVSNILGYKVVKGI